MAIIFICYFKKLRCKNFTAFLTTIILTKTKWILYLLNGLVTQYNNKKF